MKYIRLVVLLLLIPELSAGQGRGRSHTATGNPEWRSVTAVQTYARALPQSNPTLNHSRSLIMDFENTGDFALNFGDWTVIDVDKNDTYGLEGITFPHQNEAMAFISFNPSATNPSMAADQAIQPHSGQRFGACFSSNPPSNNDWFISPKVTLGTNGSFTFWIKSYNDTWGLDSYRVAVSETNTAPSSFTVISGPQPLKTTLEWTRKVFSLSSYNNKSVFVAIQCVSNDNFIMMIDDLEIIPDSSTLISANFSASKTLIKIGESINFTDQSAGSPISWSWSFPGGNPSVSNDQHPVNIRYDVAGSYSVTLKITNSSGSDSITRSGYIKVSGNFPSSASLNFESQADFTLDLDPWSTVDVRGGSTYGIEGISFPNNSQPMAYICFNPSATIPALNNMSPHSGQKLGCCFSSVPPNNPNDKWLISPKLSLGQYPRIEFWVKTYNIKYGHELFRVAVSTKSNSPADFVPLQINPESAPDSWKQKSFSLDDYANQDVYVGIQCVTDTGFIFMIDDISITSGVGMNDKYLFATPTLYPNPVADVLSITSLTASLRDAEVTVFSITGGRVGAYPVRWTGETAQVRLGDLPNGFYILKIRHEHGETTHKISVMH